VAGLFTQVIRECATNAVRHARAHHIWVAMDSHDDIVQTDQVARGLISNVSRTLWAESAFPHLTERIVGRRDAYVLALSQLEDLRGAVRMTSGGMLAPAPGSPSRTHPNALGTVGFSGCGRG